MRRGLLVLLLVIAACRSTDDGGSGPQGIHPQPQPNTGRGAKFVSPCSADKCGDAPSSIQRPACKPQPSECSWSEDNASVSYRQCPESDCGPAPGAEVCAAGTTFKGSTCGSENDAPCVWATACVPPRSTKPCPDPNGCGEGVPAIGVLCSDGGVGGLECMKFETGCNWQPSCE